MLQTAVSNSPDDGLGIMFGGALSSSSGVNDFGISIDLPLLGGSSATRQITFLFELALEGPSGALLWRARAVGWTHFSKTKNIARPLASLLLERLGRDSSKPRFAR